MEADTATKTLNHNRVQYSAYFVLPSCVTVYSVIYNSQGSKSNLSHGAEVSVPEKLPLKLEKGNF